MLLGNHFENKSKASCFTREKSEVQSREQDKREPKFPGLDLSPQSSSSWPRASVRRERMGGGTLLTRSGSL